LKETKNVNTPKLMFNGNIKASCVAASVVAGVGLTGCVPTLLTAQPKAQIVVTDASGAPVRAATVTLGTVEMHGIVGRLTRQEFLTDQDGRVAIERKRKWAVQVLLPDGGVGFSSTLCVARPGFQAVAITKPEFGDPIRVSLVTSSVKSECHWSEHQMLPRVAEWKAGQWNEVEGGPWTPDNGTMIAITSAIQAVAESTAQGYRRELRPWSEYQFQYQGRLTGTTPYVHIKALCEPPSTVDPRIAFDSRMDGSACFFEMTYDAKRGRFDSFEMSAALTEPSPSR
jgi:hypothetical protein